MFEDVITGLADYLGTSEASVELLLSIAIMVAVLLGVAVAGLNLVGTAGVLIGLVGLFVVIGWFPLWIAAVIVIITGALFATQVGTWLGAGGG